MTTDIERHVTAKNGNGTAHASEGGGGPDLTPKAPAKPVATPVVTHPLRLAGSLAARPASAKLAHPDALRRAGGDVIRATALAQTPARAITKARKSARDGAALRSASAGDTLNAGEQWVSDSGNAMLAYQEDGNLVVYVRRKNAMPDASGDWEPRWASNTNGQPVGRCVMQGDGNLVVYGPQDQAIWSSNTWGHAGAVLAIQDDENVVIYDGNTAIWSTNTWVGGVVHSNFDVRTHGFHFINNFPDGYWQFGLLRFATAGLCGGMTFTALDFYWAGRPIPTTSSTPSATSDPLGQFINGRQQGSVESNIGGWSVQILNPDDHALNYWSTHDEWNKIKASIDSGNPVSLGLGIYLNGGASHQVIAVGYREGAQERWILTCDPNSPRVEGYLHLAPGQLHWADQFGGDWRGYFVSSYVPGNPPTIAADRITLRANNGMYVCAEGGGGREVVANRSAAAEWETFNLIVLANGQVALQANNGMYMCAEGGGGGAVVANRTAIGPWKSFNLIDQGGGVISLQASNGNYVCAEGGGGREVVANRTAIGPWEQFQR